MNRFYLKSQIVTSCPLCVDFVGICILGLRSSYWHLRQANDTVASERSIFSENQLYIQE